MKTLKLIPAALIAGIISLTMFSCGKADVNDPPGNPVDTSSNHKIFITSTQFSPSSLNMLVGTTVTWTNNDTNIHSVVSDDNISFSSGNINPAAGFSFTPTNTGIYEYHCGLHPSVKGVLYVVNR